MEGLFFSEYVSDFLLITALLIVKRLIQELPAPQDLFNFLINNPHNPPPPPQQRRLRPRENLRRPARYQN